MSTSDRELLELAAKAAGIKHSGSKGGDGLWVGHANIFEGSLGRPRWNPLTDDGDALRLAVNIGVFDGPASFAKFYSWLADAMIVEDDQAKAFRRAITCYAAEVGRSMP